MRRVRKKLKPRNQKQLKPIWLKRVKHTPVSEAMVNKEDNAALPAEYLTATSEALMSDNINIESSALPAKHLTASIEAVVSYNIKVNRAPLPA
jgi:hypothetical protein